MLIGYTVSFLPCKGRLILFRKQYFYLNNFSHLPPRRNCFFKYWYVVCLESFRQTWLGKSWISYEPIFGMAITLFSNTIHLFVISKRNF